MSPENLGFCHEGHGEPLKVPVEEKGAMQTRSPATSRKLELQEQMDLNDLGE